MKNKKSMDMHPLEMVGVAVLVGIIIFVFINGVIPIFTGKQVPWLKATVDQTTNDCDGDDLVGLNDPCPCTSGSKSDESKACPPPNGNAETNCPNLCKSAKS